MVVERHSTPGASLGRRPHPDPSPQGGRYTPLAVILRCVDTDALPMRDITDRSRDYSDRASSWWRKKTRRAAILQEKTWPAREPINATRRLPAIVPLSPTRKLPAAGPDESVRADNSSARGASPICPG